MKVKKKNRWLRWINMWPPLLGAGIRVTRMDDDMRAVDVEMKLTKLNRNYVGTHYGGSLYSMADPFYMLMLMANLGRDYIVWDKAATIRFKKPGRGTVHAEFRLSDRQVQDIREQLKTHHKIEPMFTVEIKAADGEVVAEIDKLLYVRKK
jgi:acyl-coenzyme A thioesterase PaaI-like protein